MKMKRHLLPFLLILFSIFCTGCSQLCKTDVEEVVLNELDLLKNLDGDTAMKYISYKELFPDATDNTELSDKIKDVFLLFFQNFDYKILDIHVDQEEKPQLPPSSCLPRTQRLWQRISAKVIWKAKSCWQLTQRTQKQTFIPWRSAISFSTTFSPPMSTRP